ncbi:MAG: hypothetical protein ACI8Q9_000626 [Planctomycetota bacterium]|jgi:hypothetical protein
MYLMPFLAEVSDATLSWFKTAGVVVVASAFIAVVIRSIGSRKEVMDKGAGMALDDGHKASDKNS